VTRWTSTRTDPRLRAPPIREYTNPCPVLGGTGDKSRKWVVAHVLTHSRHDTTMAAAIGAIFASVNPNVAKGDELRRQIATSLSETRRLQNPNIALQRSVYKGIAALFEGLTKSDADGSVVATTAGDSSGGVVEHLKEHLFRADAGSEAVRLLRADAIAAVVGSCTALAAELRPAILSLAKEDPSTLVRARLSGAAAGASTS
jgi:proteasome component ECM29